MCMVRSVSVIFDTGYTYSCYYNKGDLAKPEEKIPPRNLEVIAKGLEIYGFGIFEYSVGSESECMIALRDKAYYVSGLPKDLYIISPQVIFTSEGYKGTLIAHFHDERDSCAELNLKEDKPGW